MIRPHSLICALMAAGAGLFLYTKKHETLVLNQNINQTIQETHRVQEQTAMLRTEWALLNQPDRLSALSKRIIPSLHQVEPNQFIHVSELSDKLPPVNHHLITTFLHPNTRVHLASFSQNTSIAEHYKGSDEIHSEHNSEQIPHTPNVIEKSLTHKHRTPSHDTSHAIEEASWHPLHHAQRAIPHSHTLPVPNLPPPVPLVN